MRRRPEPGRWSNLWWEILVGLLVVWVGLWLAWYAPEPLAAQITRAMFGRWALVIGIALVWAYLIIQSYWSLRRFAVFWAMAVASLVAIAAPAYFWFPRGPGEGVVRAVYFGVPSGAEFAAFAYLVYQKFHVLPKRNVWGG